MEETTPLNAPRKCLDCEHPVRLRFCENCGQKVGPRKRSVFDILGDAWAETFSLDGRFWRSLGPFLFKPGTLTREYNAGRRTRYIAPAKLYLLSLVLLALASSTGHVFRAFSVDTDQTTQPDVATADRGSARPEPPVSDSPEGPSVDLTIGGVEDLPTDRPFLRKLRESITRYNVGSEAERSELEEEWLAQIPSTIFVLLPLYALLLRILLMRRGIYYSEVFVFALHSHAFIYMVLTIAAPFQGTGFDLVLEATIPIAFFVSLARAFLLRWYVALIVGTLFLAIYLPILLVGLLASFTLTAGL